jgi:two-component system, sensor histidine kinase and response regulator
MVALGYTAGEEDLLLELAAVFLEDCPRQLEELGTAIGSGDTARACRAAHTLKGAVGYFGAGSAAGLANRIELLAKDGSLAVADGLFTDLEKQLGCVTEELTAWTVLP